MKKTYRARWRHGCTGRTENEEGGGMRTRRDKLEGASDSAATQLACDDHEHAWELQPFMDAYLSMTLTHSGQWPRLTHLALFSHNSTHNDVDQKMITRIPA